ncbi:hypothetical protein ASPFODRAFT_536639 [Aspergillus luchuensis CBS 106.47]|uniref:Uncharacterized protein n=1 Tax=Aspergillus luchuensis (strain CBS 106.47) TaxID=1137211 RepID=A0A1M3TN50_ASPLC|nr:hypothetical protein ASPFODRAFT_536639 [Aspergillus luchuensis CBS 106.47]
MKDCSHHHPTDSLSFLTGCIRILHYCYSCLVLTIVCVMFPIPLRRVLSLVCFLFSYIFACLLCFEPNCRVYLSVLAFALFLTSFALLFSDLLPLPFMYTTLF